MKILMVLTSHDKLGDTDHKTGLWLEEFAAPYFTLLDAGAEVTLASPKGGQPPIDPNSEAPDAQTAATDRFKADEAAQKAFANTKPLSDVVAESFDAVFYPGGHGPLWDLYDDERSIALIEDMVKANKPVAAVCHAPSVLLNVKGIDGEPLVKGRKVTGFTNSEEKGVGLEAVVPYLLEDALKAKGGDYQRVDDWQPFAVTDGKLVTGQNPASSEVTAKALLALL